MSERAKDWARSLGLPIDVARLDAWPFGDSAELADELADLVVAGTKRATAGLLWAYEHHGWQLPRAGDPIVITRWDGAPVCLIEVVSVETRRYGDVDAAFAATEGEGDGSLAYWREVHWDYFSRECASIGREPSDDMPVICEVFRVLAIHP